MNAVATSPGVKRTVIIAFAASLSAVFAALLFFALYEPAAPTTFIDSLSAAQRKEIPALLRKEKRRRAFLLLKRRQFKAAWLELRSSASEQIIAVGYEPKNTNSIWVHVGLNASSGIQPRQTTGSYAMTNIDGRWHISP